MRVQEVSFLNCCKSSYDRYDRNGNEEPGLKVVRYNLTFPEGGNAEEKYVCENNAGFYVQTTGGWVIDANSQKFAVPGASEYDSYSTRLKGSKTSDSKSMTITVPNDGKLYIAARSANSSAADRTMALMQGDKEILAPTVIQDADKFTAGDASAFPYVVVDVKVGDGAEESLPGGYSSSNGAVPVEFNITAGTVKVYATGNGLRFYKIEFHSN